MCEQIGKYPAVISKCIDCIHVVTSVFNLILQVLLSPGILRTWKKWKTNKQKCETKTNPVSPNMTFNCTTLHQLLKMYQIPLAISYIFKEMYLLSNVLFISATIGPRSKHCLGNGPSGNWVYLPKGTICKTAHLPACWTEGPRWGMLLAFTRDD